MPDVVGSASNFDMLVVVGVGTVNEVLGPCGLLTGSPIASSAIFVTSAIDRLFASASGLAVFIDNSPVASISALIVSITDSSSLATIS